MLSDPLSDVLNAVRMTGAAFFNVTASTPWVAERRSHDLIKPHFQSGPGHIISYHVVIEGSCFARILGEGEQTVRVNAGEVIIFPRGDAHILSSAPGLRADSIFPAANSEEGQLPYLIRFGRNGTQSVKVICGFLACDQLTFNPLVENLPRMIIGNKRPDKEIPWVGSLVGIAMAEATSPRPGSDSIIGKLAELMFIEAVREYVEDLPPNQRGWLAGLRDPVIGRALALMHHRPGCDWRLENLARQAGSSRSGFAERFTCLVGAPPMQYLTRWRMQVASGLLRDNLNVATVADRVGYGSEASFCRAFKRFVGVSPALWRRKGRGGIANIADNDPSGPAPTGMDWSTGLSQTKRALQ